MKLHFIGKGAKGRSEYINPQRLVNLFPQYDKTAKAIVSLYGTPGLALLATLGGGPHRASMPYDNVGYLVSGGGFYSIDTAYAATLRGSLTSGSGYVSIATHGL